jgi:hypothetical protein
MVKAVEPDQAGGRVAVFGENRWISLLCMPEYVKRATLCVYSAAFAGKY